MKLVEAEAEGPIEGEDAVVTPPRLPHRRVSISILFTLTVLVGTVVAIYVVLPARNNVLMTEAIAQHHKTEDWDYLPKTPAELRAWSVGVVDRDAPLPAIDTIIGVRSIVVFDRRAAVVRYAVGDDEVTYLVQHNRGIAPAHSERVDGDLRAVAWRRGKFITVAVGPDGTAARWLARVAPRPGS